MSCVKVFKDNETKLKYVRERVDSFPDFPKPGILFRDVFSVLRDPVASAYLFELLIDEVNKLKNVDAIVGLDSRGFLFGPHIAVKLAIPFVPIRKHGKLPGKVKQASFTLEYGNDTLELQESSISPGQNVVVVDDLLATGGTLEASCNLIKEVGAHVLQCVVVMELVELNGRKRLNSPVASLIQF